LERDGLVEIRVGSTDRREREVTLSEHGRQREADGRPLWLKAQKRFEQEFGSEDAEAMRRIMARIAAMELNA
jgi:DNA-binding MarR family transcriptional regulator